MRILIVGDTSGTFLLNFVKHLKTIDEAIVIDALNIHESNEASHSAKISGHFRNIFSHFRSFGLINKIPKLRGILRESHQFGVERKIFANHDYEVICLFGMWPLSCRLINRMKRKGKSSFWIGVMMGSDYLQMNNRKDKISFLNALKACHRLITGNPVIFNRIANDKLVVSANLRNLYFGLAPLELLEKMKHIERADAKRYFGIAPDTLVITCGYNASPNQQHIEIINAITTIGNIPVGHLILVPLTYGGNVEYKCEIKKTLNESGLKFRTVDSFLSDTDIAMWRKASDIFIQVQKTDAFSGSMQESLFCGNIVITGSWLPYQDLKERGILFFEVDAVEEVGKKLKYILNNYNDLPKEVESKNTAEKFKEGFWKNSIRGWYDVLNEFRLAKKGN